MSNQKQLTAFVREWSQCSGDDTSAVHCSAMPGRVGVYYWSPERVVRQAAGGREQKFLKC